MPGDGALVAGSNPPRAAAGLLAGGFVRGPPGGGALAADLPEAAPGVAGVLLAALAPEVEAPPELDGLAGGFAAAGVLGLGG